jgi:hypothetical protein
MNENSTLLIINHAREEHVLDKKSLEVLIVISALFALLNTRTIVSNRSTLSLVCYDTKKLAVHKNISKQNQHKNTFDSTNMLGFMTLEHNKARQNGRSYLKGSLKHSNKSNQSYNTFVMATQTMYPITPTLFSLPTFSLFEDTTKASIKRHPSKGRLQEIYMKKPNPF